MEQIWSISYTQQFHDEIVLNKKFNLTRPTRSMEQ
jgi:hypothetical protein